MRTDELTANKSFQDDLEQGIDPLKIQRVALAIFTPKIPFFILIFILAFALLEYIFWRQKVSRPDRYVAHTTLVYNPQGTNQYPPLDSNLVGNLFLRSNLRRAVAAKLGLSPAEEARLGGLIEVQQVKNTVNFLQISCKGTTAEEALQLNQTVVAIGIEEFLKFRNSDLSERLDALQKQKDAGLKELAEYELEMQKLLEPVSLTTPEQQLDKLRRTITDQVMAVSELEIKINNLRQKLNEVNELLKGIDPNIEDHLNTINYYIAEEERVTRELLRLRQLYTEQNPKITASQTELKLIREQKEAYAKEKNLTRIDPNIMQQLQQLKDNQKIFGDELADLTQQHEIAQQELEYNKKLSENLLPNLTAENKLNNQIFSVRNTLRKVDADLPVLKTLIASVPQELMVLEPAGGAILTDQGFMKKTVVALLLAGILVFNVALVWVIIVYCIGKIESTSEITMLTDIACLGEFPDLKNSSLDEDNLLKISHDLFFQLKDYLKDEQIIFEVGFIGSANQDKIRELLSINFAMNGMRYFNLICDSCDSIQKQKIERNPESCCTDWEEDLLAVEKINAGLGYFCVSNPQLLLSSEIEILSRDIGILKKHYDMIVLSCKRQFHGNELSFRQYTDLADITVMFFGFQKTSRRILHQLARMKKSLSGQLCCLLTGVKNK